MLLSVHHGILPRAMVQVSRALGVGRSVGNGVHRLSFCSSSSIASPPPTPKVTLPSTDADWVVDENKYLAPDVVRSTTLEQMTPAELELGSELYRQATTAKHLASRACDLLFLLKGTHMELGFPVDLYTHSLQSATRAHRDGAGDETIVCALLHDIGEMLCPSNHGDVAAAILRPYISRKMHWVLANHEVFQGYYYFGKVGLDKNCREHLRDAGGSGSGVPNAVGAPEGAYELCIEFCEKYDMNSFDPDYSNMELSEFQPMLLNVFSQPPWWDQPENLKSGAVTGI
jgi:predicted HD phosphohydrolase